MNATQVLPTVEGLTPTILWYTLVGLVGLAALFILGHKVIEIFRKEHERKIEKEELDKVWDIFYTTDKARTDRMSSSGVGLSVVKSILDAHKADYGCTSGDKGTEFKFSMPAHETA